MITFTANDSKQQLGHVLDTARTGPVSITKHGRPSFVITSQEDYDSLIKLKYERLKQEVQSGFDQLGRKEFSNRSFAQIAEQAVDLQKKIQDDEGFAAFQTCGRRHAIHFPLHPRHLEREAGLDLKP